MSFSVVGHMRGAFDLELIYVRMTFTMTLLTYDGIWHLMFCHFILLIIVEEN